MNLKKHILSLLVVFLSTFSYSQVITPTPASAVDTACLGDTSFAQVLFYNNGNNPLVIDSIVSPGGGFGHKGAFPVTISIASTYPNNFYPVDFYYYGTTLGLHRDTFYVYTNAANVPRPFKLAASMFYVPSPSPSFTVNDTDQCRNANSFVFTNTSSISSGSMTYDWFFDDATTSTATSPTKNYTTADTFNVTLIASSNYGCERVYQRNVIVFPSVATLISSSSTIACLNENSFTFNDASTLSSGNYTVKWYFGDGDSSTQSNTTHIYNKDSSSFKLRLVATSDKGCSTSDSQDIFVYPSPNASFTINDSTQCLNGNSYAFTSTSTVKSGGLTYNWNFGDVTTSTATNPTKNYLTSGSRNVRLVVRSDFGCPDTLIKPVTVFSKPNVNFSISDSTQCLVNNFFSFTNLSSITAPDTMFYLWRFGDGGTSTDTNTSHQYAAVGSYPAKLLVTSNNGCKDSLTRTDILYPHANAEFIINDSSQCLNAQNFAFANISNTPSGGTIAGYSWRFGNGDTSNVTNPTKSNYGAPDTLTVMLIARTTETCYDTVSKQVIIYPVPQVKFIIPDTALCFSGHQFVFNDTSTIDYGTLSHSWQFGDGGTSKQADTVYTYAGLSTFYTVNHTVTSDQGCAATGFDSVYLFPSPTADFSTTDSTQCLRGNSYTFFDASSVSSGTITHFWKFGNTDTSSQINPVYVYNYADTFNVVLTVTSDKGCTDSTTLNSIVYPHPATKFTVNNNNQCFVGNVFNFADNSSIPYGILSYFWDFGDATNANTTTFNKSYTSADTFDIVYTVTSDQGCDSSITSRVFVNPSPTASFTVNDSTQCLNGNQFLYTNTSTVSSGNLFYEWDFGNGSTSTSFNGGAIYITTGSYLVRLKVRTNFNCEDSTRHTASVFPKPTASFAINDPIQCFGVNNFVLTNNSSISSGTLTYFWDLGDGTTSTQTNVTHAYLVPDTFVVRFRATSTDGCSDSIQRNLFVHPDPTAAFTVDDSTQCLDGNLFTFTNNSTIASGTMAYIWNYGDFSADLVANPPPKEYTNADTFDVSLIITATAGGCADTALGRVFVYDTPDPSFNGLAKQYCVNSPAVTLTPMVGGGTFSGDNVVGNEFTPTLIGWNKITYGVEVAEGCADTATDSTLVVPPPSFDLGPDTVFCKEDFFTLNATTLGAQYLWSDNSKDPTFRITSPGTHTVSVTNACGTVSDSIRAQYLDFACDAFMPNAFTPEGNTVNDYFKPYIDTTIVKGILFLVFSRWGTKIFETTDLATLGWNGYHNGAPAPEGVYGYLLSMTIQREDVRILKSIKGNFHLLR